MLKFLEQQCEGPVPVEALHRNLEAALSYGFPMVKKLEAHNRSLAIVGGGPSVSDDIETLRSWSGEIWACNGALAWLLERGIKADAFVMMDPHPVMRKFLENPPEGVTYYIVSFADPGVLDAVKDRNVILWHVGGKECPAPKGYGAVGGGPTILSRAPMLAYALGFRDVHLFGADSSYDHGDHSYPPLYGNTRENPVPKTRVQLDGVEYISDVVMFHQVAYFQAIHAWYSERGANFEIHGKGLGPAILKAHMHSVGEFDDPATNPEAA